MQPIDRLYALLGLAEDAAGYQPIYSAEQTAVVASTRFAATFVNNGHLPLILATAGTTSQKFSPNCLPSWVPDWTRVRYTQDMTPGFTRFSILRNEEIQKQDDDRQKTQTENTATDPSIYD
ncbi:hypothetical protein QQS21_010219 [Conoideocrella luteorostrata]|uniref:Uncharacterized protein n=1 Tax=Conoideocrella luteorostrata TaxID=1105319 RepID=A0AAJ0CHS3_9HYPO|nr:hypothetical protein QQS21_010219 [Conoideocrella luteorostrata]